MSTPGEFPLPGLLRRVVEGNLDHAREMRGAAEKDVRLLLDGKSRTAVFKSDTDPVQVLIETVRQERLCEVVIEMDDEARKRGAG